MFELPFSKLSLFLSALFALFILLLILLHNLFDQRTKLVFCDVAQGDGIYIRLQNHFDLLIDAGPGRQILNCLGKHMPFYDRSIELAINSHPQSDHYAGFLYLIDRYDIKKFWLNPVINSNKSYNELLTRIKKKKIPVDNPKATDKVFIFNSKIRFLWPTEDFLLMNSQKNNKNSYTLGSSIKDLNFFSLVFILNTNGTNILFTGDFPGELTERLLHQSNLKSDILKIPHHGSKNGLNLELLELADPTYGVISVGKNNSYGHPSREILELLSNNNIKIRRTDIEGDIVFKLPN